MATQAVRFEFHCMETDGKLRVVHEIPRSLLNVDTRLAQSDAEYQQRFADALRPIFKEHEPACKAMSGPSCANCGSPTVKALQTTQSWLHRPGDPMVLVWVYPACGEEHCRTQILQASLEVTAEANEERERRNLPGPTTSYKVAHCNVCRKTEGVKWCSRCSAVAYCGKDHQKADWKTHKKDCAARANVDSESTRIAATSNDPVVAGDPVVEGYQTTLDNITDPNPEVSITHSGVFNVSAPGEPERYVELSREEVLAQLLGSGRG